MINSNLNMTRTKNTKKILKDKKFTPYRDQYQTTSPECDPASPPSPRASLFEPLTSSNVSRTARELENKVGVQKGKMKQKGQKENINII